MTIEILEVTEEEFELIRPHFEVKAQALAQIRRMVDDNGTIIDTPAKDWHWGGFDKSKCVKAIINGETFIVAAGNVITEVITKVLPAACQKFPQNFGTNDAHAIIDALYQTQPIPFHAAGADAEKFFSTEQFAFCFKLNPDNSVDQRVLRLDLFRLIQPGSKRASFEFTGGLMHLLKHYKMNGYSLSTDPGESELSHPTAIISKVIHTFFQTSLVPDGKSLLAYIPEDATHNLKIVFFEEPIIDVYFIRTGYIEDKSQQKTATP